MLPQILLEVMIQVFNLLFKVGFIFIMFNVNFNINTNTLINLNITEVPEIPFGLKVLDKSGRTVQLSWLAPYDGNSLITRYIVEYKLLKGKCII